MIKSIGVGVVGKNQKLDKNEFLECAEVKASNFSKVSISFSKPVTLKKLYLEIEFNQMPTHWRAADYTWKDIATPYLSANYHSPKILKFPQHKYVVGMNALGCWEWDHKHNKLIWFLIHPDIQPSFVYDKDDKRQWVNEIEVPKGQRFELGIYHGEGPVPELARSPIGFVPTVTITDHCDFDTPHLLATQRGLFKQIGLKITKGFFLHSFSHRGSYAAMDQEEAKEEYKKWELDGHELAYHGLSRSFRPESWKEFDEFDSPAGFKPITTYIDHGYLEYNFTKQPIHERAKWFEHMSNKGINLIWNYVDCMESNSLSNNQLNPVDSSLSLIRKATKFQRKYNLPVDPKRMSKTWVSYGTSEEFDYGIKNLGEALKPSQGAVKPLNVVYKAISLIPIALDRQIWKRNLFERTRPFKFARFSPLFFKLINHHTPDIALFQTVSVKDFISVFSQPSLNKLKQEAGILVAHTYLAFLGRNHPGRLFLNESGAYNAEAKASVERLGKEIQAGKIWNPTVKELYEFHKKIQSNRFEYVDGKLMAINPPATVRYIE